MSEVCLKSLVLFSPEKRRLEGDIIVAYGFFTSKYRGATLTSPLVISDRTQENGTEL